MDSIEIYDTQCPYNCIKGVLFNPRTHQKTPCPHCAKLRQDTLFSTSMELQPTSEDVEAKLGIKKRLVGKLEYSFDAIFRTGTTYMDSASLSEVKEFTDKLMGGVSLGELPKYSILFNFGPKVYEENFVNPLLLKGYMAGINVAPLLSAYKVAELRRHVESVEYYNEEESKEYLSYLDADLCVIILDEGISKNGVDIVKGFVATRGRGNKPTILLTHSNMRDILYEFATTEDYFDYTYPKLVSVSFRKKDTLNVKEPSSHLVDKGEESEVRNTLQSAPSISMSALAGDKSFL